MKFLYFLGSIPIFLMSIFFIIISPRIRMEYKLVNNAIENHPRSSFEDLLTDLLIAAEDHRYMFHFGFDHIAIVRAIFRILILRKVEGASTIEQQLVRTVTKKYGISLKRKIEEISISLLISINNNKSDIAYTYLSIAFFGYNSVGYKSASKMLEKYGSSTYSVVLQGAAIVALLKRPMPSRKNESWKNLHKARKYHIVNRYNTLILNGR